MSMSDPLADMLTRIRNAGMVKFTSVDVPSSKLKEKVADLLKKEGYISDFNLMESGGINKTLKIELKYNQANERAITGLRRISKPGRRVYAKFNEIPKVMSGLGISILSTSQGLMTDRYARDHKVGGEILCEVW